MADSSLDPAMVDRSHGIVHFGELGHIIMGTNAPIHTLTYILALKKVHRYFFLFQFDVCSTVQ